MERRTFAGIFLFSFSSLSYEIVLTRIFSIALWYHFAFMVISIAMLGLGASGTLLSLYPRLKESRNIGIYGLLLGASVTVSYAISNLIPFDPVRLSWDGAQIFYIMLYYLVLSIPFFFFGLIIASALAGSNAKSGMVYGADLLGAGAGSLCLLCFLSVVPPETVVVLLGSLAATGALIIGTNKVRMFAVFVIIGNALLLTAPTAITPRMSPYKGLQLALQYPGAQHLKTYSDPFVRIDTFKSPAVRFAPGLSLTYLNDLPPQIGISIDGGDVNAITSAADTKSLEFLKHLPSALPYEISKRDDVLILEPRGGLEVLLARSYGSQRIHAVDSLPLMIRVIRSSFSDLTRGMYGKHTQTGMGRSWLKTGGLDFDVIDISLTSSTPSASFGIAEDYRFTVEAFKEYLRHLKEDGVLSVHTFILPPPRIELRLLGTLVTAMEEMGIEETGEHIVSIRSWGTVCTLAKRVPFTANEIEAVRDFSKRNRFDLVHLPGIREEETNLFVKMPSNEYYRAFTAILDPGTRRTFQDHYLFDIRPVRDENPFFHYYLKLKNTGEVYKLLGGKWQYFIEEGYLLPAIFGQVVLLSTVLIILPLRMKVPVSSTMKGSHFHPDEGFSRSLFFYFASLGVGFMFTEVSLIHQVILPTENPPYAFAAVLTSLLLSSGIGSLLSTRVSLLRSPYLPLVIAGMATSYGLVLPSITDNILSLSLPLRIGAIVIALFPLGLAMGIPFPTGIGKLGESHPEAIPWAWAINGCLSVVAPLAAVLIAVAVGFRVVLWLGGGAYLLAYIFFPASGNRRTPGVDSQERQ